MNEPPVVEQMILCDEVRVHPGKLKKWDIIGLVFRFRSSKKERPIRMPRLSVFLRLANGRGEGEGRIVFVEYDTGRPCGASRSHHFQFGANPLQVYGATFAVTNCKFPRPGYYLVEFRYNGVILADQLLLIEE